jgi:23S rRNA (cytidine1920-2'-O)/16S rRNA (cytidine1409-2'-O)-methyltransferase
MARAVAHSDRLRLDRALVARGLVSSRSKAQQAIAAGGVTLNGTVVIDTDRAVAPEDVIVATAAHPWVSRGGLKLAAALEHFAITPAGRFCLDVGSSTGGFTHVLLEQGAARVLAVDVGKDQFAAELRSDPRVDLREGLDARDLTTAHVLEAPSLIVTDVSFISLTKALPAALALAAPSATLVALVKPQFEVGRAGVGRGGIVRDAGLRAEAVRMVSAWLSTQGWRPREAIPSPITGGDGNEEFLLVADRT